MCVGVAIPYASREVHSSSTLNSLQEVAEFPLVLDVMHSISYHYVVCSVRMRNAWLFNIYAQD